MTTCTAGAAQAYAVLGLSGTHVDLHNTTVNGAVGAATGGKFDVMAPSIVNVDVFLASGVPLRMVGTVNGVVHTAEDLSLAVSDVTSAADADAALNPTQTCSTWSGPVTVNGNGGLNVIQVGSVNLQGGGYVTLGGGPNDRFIVNVTRLEAAIRRYVEATNDDPRPFVWTKSADEIIGSVARFSAHTLAQADS